MKIFKLLILSGLILTNSLNANEDVRVKITDDIPYLFVHHMGQKVKIGRIQDTNNLLTDDYTKTSRECPPFCINPTKIDKNVQTIAEIEMIEFMKNNITSKNGVVIDARLKSWYELETIPSAVNIPYTVIQNANKETTKKIFALLGVKVNDDKWSYENAKELAVFCNGVWCKQSNYFINAMLKHGYPAEKIFYYRSGFQGWKLLGLTTVVQKENKKGRE